MKTNPFSQPLSLKTPAMFLALLLAVPVISMILMVSPQSVSAQTILSQCNGTDNVGGQAVECHYTITNRVNGSATSSTVILQECHGAANDPATLVCSSSTTNSSSLVTSVDQCNGSGSGGGGTVLCTVDVINRITGTVTPSSATVNQCNASGEDGGTAPTVVCDPFPANTTGATVTQCNGSGNGGGGTMRVQCTVDSDSTTTSVLNVTVNQCNGSGNGGGATVTCRTGLTNIVTAPGGPGGGGPGGGGPGGGGPGGGGPGGGGPGGPDGPGGPGAPGGGPPDLTTNQIVRVPTGGVPTGGGSTSGMENEETLLLGFLFLAVGSALVLRRQVRDRV